MRHRQNNQRDRQTDRQSNRQAISGSHLGPTDTFCILCQSHVVNCNWVGSCWVTRPSRAGFQCAVVRRLASGTAGPRLHVAQRSHGTANSHGTFSRRLAGGTVAQQRLAGARSHGTAPRPRGSCGRVRGGNCGSRRPSGNCGSRRPSSARADYFPRAGGHWWLHV